MAPLESAESKAGDYNCTVTGPHVAVMGIGNVLMKDDGFGIHMIRNLVDKIDPGEVELIDAGTAPDIFSMLGEHIEKLVIVDGADGQEEPGTIYRLSRADIEAGSSSPVSLHEIGLSENLKILELMNPKLKKVTLFGVQIADINPGIELSKVVAEAMPKVTGLILEEIAKTD